MMLPFGGIRPILLLIILALIVVELSTVSAKISDTRGQNNGARNVQNYHTTPANRYRYTGHTRSQASYNNYRSTTKPTTTIPPTNRRGNRRRTTRKSNSFARSTTPWPNQNYGNRQYDQYNTRQNNRYIPNLTTTHPNNNRYIPNLTTTHPNNNRYTPNLTTTRPNNNGVMITMTTSKSGSGSKLIEYGKKAYEFAKEKNVTNVLRKAYDMYKNKQKTTKHPNNSTLIPPKNEKLSVIKTKPIELSPNSTDERTYVCFNVSMKLMDSESGQWFGIKILLNETYNETQLSSTSFASISESTHHLNQTDEIKTIEVLMMSESASFQSNQTDDAKIIKLLMSESTTIEANSDEIDKIIHFLLPNDTTIENALLNSTEINALTFNGTEDTSTKLKFEHNSFVCANVTVDQLNLLE